MRWPYRKLGHRAEDGQRIVELLDGGDPLECGGGWELEWLAGARFWRIINPT